MRAGDGGREVEDAHAVQDVVVHVTWDTGPRPRCQGCRAAIRAHLRRYGALVRALNVEQLRLAPGLRAPPRSWTLLAARLPLQRSLPRAASPRLARRPPIRAHLRRYGALVRALNVEQLRLAPGLRAPPRSWTLLAARLPLQRSLPRAASPRLARRPPIRVHLLRWRPRPGAQRRATTSRARPSGAASQLDPSRRPAPAPVLLPPRPVADRRVVRYAHARRSGDRHPLERSRAHESDSRLRLRRTRGLEARGGSHAEARARPGAGAQPRRRREPGGHLLAIEHRQPRAQAALYARQ
jgi:hypothetical protein